MSATTAEELEELMLGKMPFSPTPTQGVAIHALSRLMCTDCERPTLVINGYAGTGKTTLLRAFCDTMSQVGVTVVLMAPTGRAAKVLSAATGRWAMTIHRTIYRQESSTDSATFANNYNSHRNAVFIVDEASMIGDDLQTGLSAQWGDGHLLSNLIDYVFSQPGCRLILVGDPDQLPPVGQDTAPALDVGLLRRAGLTVGRVWLRDVVRQEKRSLILENAFELRNLIDDETPLEALPTMTVQQDGDVELVNGENLLEKLEWAMGHYGSKETVVVTRSNKRATQFNLGIRSQILYSEEKLMRGDLLMVVKNNYLWDTGSKGGFIANGDVGEVVSINGYSEMHRLHFADVTLRFDNQEETDCKILLDLLDSDVMGRYGIPNITTEEVMRRLEQGAASDYGDERNMRKRIELIRKDVWLNALQVRYAYAMTCHKAQGGQWSAVFVDLGYYEDLLANGGLARWLYTATTRAAKNLYLVNYRETREA